MSGMMSRCWPSMKFSWPSHGRKTARAITMDREPAVLERLIYHTDPMIRGLHDPDPMRRREAEEKGVSL
jgi:hypothetical protein